MAKAARSRSRRRRSPAERKQILRDWKRSGLSAERFSATHDVCADSLYRWKREAAAGGAAPASRARHRPPAAAFVQVVGTAAAAPPAHPVVVELRDGRRVHCAADVAPAQVAALVAALDAVGPATARTC